MLKRSDGEYLLTKEIYDKARRGEDIPFGIDFYDGESRLHIHARESVYIGYFLAMYVGFSAFRLCDVREHTIEEIRELVRLMGKTNDQPLPSEAAEAPFAESKLDEILSRLDKLEQSCSAKGTRMVRCLNC